MRTFSKHYTLQKLPQITSKSYDWLQKKDTMSIHSNEFSRPPSRKEIVNWKQLLLRSVENTNFEISKSQFTQNHEQSQN